MSKAAGIVLANTSLLVGNSAPVTLNVGMQGVIVYKSQSGNDPALTQAQVNLKLSGAAAGSGYIFASSSKVMTDGCLLGPMYFPAGEYVVRVIGGSTVVNAYAAIFPAL